VSGGGNAAVAWPFWGADSGTVEFTGQWIDGLQEPGAKGRTRTIPRRRRRRGTCAPAPLASTRRPVARRDLPHLLGGGTDSAFDRQLGQELLDMFSSGSLQVEVPGLQELRKPPIPVAVSLLGAPGLMV
jgi:hypothetical protein